MYILVGGLVLGAPGIWLAVAASLALGTCSQTDQDPVHSSPALPFWAGVQWLSDVLKGDTDYGPQILPCPSQAGVLAAS